MKEFWKVTDSSYTEGYWPLENVFTSNIFVNVIISNYHPLRTMDSYMNPAPPPPPTPYAVLKIWDYKMESLKALDYIALLNTLKF